MSHRPVRAGGAGRRLATLLGLAVLVLGIALLAGAIGAVSDDGGGPRHVSRSGERVAVVPPAKPATRAAAPVRIEIPAIGVRAPIIRLGLNPDRTLEVPKDFGDTGWWSGGPRPGEPGPAVVVGHVDSHTGPAVFFRLGELRPHDEIVIVRRDGSRVRFNVVESERYAKAEFPTARVYGRTKGPTLRLITCGGVFDSNSGHYLDNTVVYAR
jgi:hypothetical protein